MYLINDYVNQLSVTVLKYLRKSSYRRKHLFWLMMTAFSVYDHLAPLCLHCGEARTSWWGVHGVARLVNSWQSGSRKRERTWQENIPFKGLSPVTYFLQLDPIS
jgi:hypothetical protein